MPLIQLKRWVEVGKLETPAMKLGNENVVEVSLGEFDGAAEVVGIAGVDYRLEVIQTGED